MPGISFKEKQSLRYYMCDRTNSLTMPMLVNLLLEVSGKQSALLELGSEAMEQMGYTWIILQYEFHIKRMPKFTEEIEIETFATEYNKLFCYRDFIVRDDRGEELVLVHTTFALIEQEKRRLTRLPQEIVDPYKADFNKRLKRIPKPASLDEENLSRQSYRVRYFDIDTNQHVNNSHYLNWVLDSLGADFLIAHKPTYGNIKFEKEVHEKETVDSYASIIEKNGIFTSAHRIQVGKTVNCTASFNWSK